MAGGAQEIVLLPGLDGTGDFFDRVASHLARRIHRHVVRYPNDPSLGYAGYVELVRKAIGAREVFLLGKSFSGPVAIRVAAQLGRADQGARARGDVRQIPWPGWLLQRASRVDPETTPRKLRDMISDGPLRR